MTTRTLKYTTARAEAFRYRQTEAAKAILENPERYPAALIAWAQMFLARSLLPAERFKVLKDRAESLQCVTLDTGGLLDCESAVSVAEVRAHGG